MICIIMGDTKSYIWKEKNKIYQLDERTSQYNTNSDMNVTKIEGKQVNCKAEIQRNIARNEQKKRQKRKEKQPVTTPQMSCHMEQNSYNIITCDNNYSKYKESNIYINSVGLCMKMTSAY